MTKKLTYFSNITYGGLNYLKNMNLKFNLYMEKQKKDKSPPNKKFLFRFSKCNLNFEFSFSKVIKDVITYVRKIFLIFYNYFIFSYVPLKLLSYPILNLSNLS
jgi:hypothetical protein